MRDDEALRRLVESEARKRCRKGYGMELIQRRDVFGEDFTLSKLYLNGEVLAACPYILEDKVREKIGIHFSHWKIPKETAIPVGRYELQRTFSGRWHKMMWELRGVQGFSGIRPHAGNFSADTEGCPITGMRRNMRQGEVQLSRVARDGLYELLDEADARGERIFWTVEGWPK